MTVSKRYHRPTKQVSALTVPRYYMYIRMYFHIVKSLPNDAPCVYPA
jgi:hypothetical protein